MNTVHGESERLPVEASPEVEQRPFLVSLLLSLLFGLLAVLVCGIAWGLISYWTNTIYFWVAIFIGFIVTAVTTLGFKRINIGIALLLLVPCVALALLSVALGDFVFYTLSAARDLKMSWMEAGQSVAEIFVDLEMAQEGLASLVLGGIGAVVGFFRAVRQ